LRTRAIRKCSTAPAEAFATAGVTVAALADDEAGRPRALGAARDRPEVLGVLQLVEGDDERRVGREQLAGADVGVAARLGADALVVGRAAAALDLVGVHDPRPDVAQPRLARRALGRPDAFDLAAPGPQRLAHGIAPVEDHCSMRTSSGPAGPSRTSQPRARSSSRMRSASA
jgi:hypothetical protein